MIDDLDQRPLWVAPDTHLVHELALVAFKRRNDFVILDPKRAWKIQMFRSRELRSAHELAERPKNLYVFNSFATDSAIGEIRAVPLDRPPRAATW
ncbi:MAG: hypothetical protein WCB99_13870 [Candidatus Cybelea sp.]